MTSAPPTSRAGPVRVTTSRETVRAFRREAGWRAEDGAVPLSFPVVWMKIPEIGGAISDAAREVGAPVHESQEFQYKECLQIDEVYDLMLELRRETEPQRLIATAEILAEDGRSVGTVVTTIRLVSAEAVREKFL
jgi:hypothetical protein